MTMQGRILLVWILLGLGAGSVSAGEYPVVEGQGGSSFLLRVWGKSSGMPHETVTAIERSADGFLWLGTFDGLARFDGRHFRSFGLSDGLASNRITSLHVDSRGDVWVGHEFEGVSRIVGERILTYSAADGLPSGSIWKIREDATGTIWLGSDAGLASFRDGIFRHHRPLDEPVQALLVDSSDGLWVGGAHGLSYRAPGTEDFSPVGPKELTFSILEDSHGAIWVATEAGLLRSTRGENESEASSAAVDRTALSWTTVIEAPCPEERSSSMAGLVASPDGSLWFRPCAINLLVNDTHLFRLPPGSLRESQPAVEELDLLGVPATSALLASEEGGLWLGTYGSGVGALIPRLIQRFAPQEPSNVQELRTMVGDGEGGLWIGADCNAPLIHFRDGRFLEVDRDPAGGELVCIGALARGSADELWVGSGGSVVRIRGDSVERRALVEGEPALKIYSILEAPAAHGPATELWVGLAGHGLARLDMARGLATSEVTYYTHEDGLAGDHVHSLAFDRSGDLWIGTHQGLSRLSGGVIETFGEEHGMAPGMVRVIYEDRDGVLWIGTYGGGLVRYQGGRFTRMGRTDGLFDDVVTQLLEDRRGRFWMLGNQGLFFLHREQLEAFAAGEIKTLSSVFFDEADGMAEGSGGRQPAGWQMADGRLFFPTVEGLAMVDSERVDIDEELPRVSLEQILVEGRQIQDPVVEMNPQERDLEIHYTAPGSFDAEKIRFRYRLEGFDEDWNEVGDRRTAYYTGVPPGEYTFRVGAANRYGLWSEPGAAISVRIHPPWWRSRWAHALYALAILGLVLAYMRRQRARIRHGQELLAERTEEVKRLGDLLPICASCKKVRDDEGYWERLEVFFSDRTNLRFSHGYCPECAQRALSELD